MRRIAVASLAVLCVAAVPVARAADITGDSLNIEVFGGWQNLQLSTQSVANAVSGNEGTAILGGDVLYKTGLLGVGLSLDKTLSGSAQPWAGNLLLGIVFDLLPSLRLEALGEIGRYGHDFGDMFNSNGQWFLGVRPGVSFRLLPTPIRIGAAALVRWPTSGSSFGSPNYGFVATAGLEFP